MTKQGSEPVEPPVLPLQVATLAQLAPRGAWQASLPHGRDDHLLVWITRGQGRAMIRGIRRGIGANNVLYLPRGTQFALETGAQCFGQAIVIEAGDYPLLPDEPQHLRMRDVVAQGELTGIFEMLQRELGAPQPLQAEALVARFNLAAVWLRRQMLAMLEAGDKVSPALMGRETAGQRLSRRFADLLEAEYRSGRNMADYAEMLEVTPTHLTRVCRDNAGLTAAEMITQRVLHAARELLLRPEPPVQEVARHLGFGSAAYFSRFIQHHTGHAPSALRRAASGDGPARPRPAPGPLFRHHGGGG
ncbi:AraC family transcriptional regulator [Marinovum sp.]|uniref:AraC family transcriptional regulator n=1 Tax=Marinovum sp. TaxID=2024839 RepID=UPI002B26D222|nr:AraC family transcriptional regulator [Marinovum sp.]